jgi:hypothetical protein
VTTGSRAATDFSDSFASANPPDAAAPAPPKK